MPSLKDNFEELLLRLRHGRELGYASFEPIYYLIFDPVQILDVRRQIPAWMAKLRNAGWDVHSYSFAEQVADVLQNSPLRKIWIAEDRKHPLEWDKTNKALANAIVNSSLESGLIMKLEELVGKKNPLLLVTDLEALHPYIRVGAIESKLQGKVHIPMVFLYPGERTGTTKLKFLNFYPEDGNYRSTHIGG